MDFTLCIFLFANAINFDPSFDLKREQHSHKISLAVLVLSKYLVLTDDGLILISKIACPIFYLL